MKPLLSLLLASLVLALAPLRAAEDPVLAAVRAADDERVAATKAGDRARLEAIFSPELHYAHSSGKIDTYASFVEALSKRTTVYERMTYQQRDFRVAAPGVVLMTGRVLADVANAKGKQTIDLTFLGVWRLENGRWRFLAWQSCKNPAPEAK